MSDESRSSNNRPCQDPWADFCIGSISREEYETPTVLPMGDVIAAVKLGEFNLKDTTSIGSISYCQVCLNDNNETSQCKETKNNASFIQTAMGTSSIGNTDKQRQAAYNPVNNYKIIKVGIIAVDGATTIGTRHPNETPHRRPARAKAQTGATPIMLDVWDLCQITKTTETIATLPVRVCNIQAQQTRKHYQVCSVGTRDVMPQPQDPLITNSLGRWVPTVKWWHSMQRKTKQGLSTRKRKFESRQLIKKTHFDFRQPLRKGTNSIPYQKRLRSKSVF